MGKGKARRREPKSRQIHFWVAPSVYADFERAATGLGEKLTDAHRAALQTYADRHSDEGTVFLLETVLKFGLLRFLARIFTRGENEILVRLSGAGVATVARQLRSLGDLVDLTPELRRRARPVGRPPQEKSRRPR